MSISLLMSIYHLRCLSLFSLFSMTMAFSFSIRLLLLFFFSLSLFTCKIMVGCRSCTYPSIHLFMALSLKITVGCRPCILGPSWKESGELWARPPVLTPAPSQAIDSSPPIAVGNRRVRIPRNSHTCFDSLVRVSKTPERLAHMLHSLIRVSQQQRWNHQTTKSPLFGLLLSGSQELVVTTWAREVRGVVFHTTRWTQRWTREYDKEPWRQKAHYRIPKAVWRWTGAGCGRGWLQWPHMATENRKDCDHAGQRPATQTPTPTKNSANSRVISVQVENLIARCTHTASKPLGELNILQLLQKTTRALSQKKTHQCMFEFHSSWHS